MLENVDGGNGRNKPSDRNKPTPRLHGCPLNPNFRIIAMVRHIRSSKSKSSILQTLPNNQANINPSQDGKFPNQDHIEGAQSAQSSSHNTLFRQLSTQTWSLFELSSRTSSLSLDIFPQQIVATPPHNIRLVYFSTSIPHNKSPAPAGWKNQPHSRHRLSPQPHRNTPTIRVQHSSTPYPTYTSKTTPSSTPHPTAKANPAHRTATHT